MYMWPHEGGGHVAVPAAPTAQVEHGQAVDALGGCCYYYYYYYHYYYYYFYYYYYYYYY